jgi:hypothetical protein
MQDKTRLVFFKRRNEPNTLSDGNKSIVLPKSQPAQARNPEGSETQVVYEPDNNRNRCVLLILGMISLGKAASADATDNRKKGSQKAALHFFSWKQSIKGRKWSMNNLRPDHCSE